jgi:hypothetical protein
MKSIPHLDYSKLKKAQVETVGKYGNLANYLKERSGVSINDASLDKRLRTFFEDMITEILKNPAEWDRTRNINFMELFNYLEEQEQGKGREQLQEQKLGKLASTNYTYKIIKNEGEGLKGYGWSLLIFKDGVCVDKSGAYGAESIAEATVQRKISTMEGTYVPDDDEDEIV